ncbi:hypothetical protein Emag_004361 [Eimeria magna]
MASKAAGSKKPGGGPSGGGKQKLQRKYSQVQLGDYLIGSNVWVRDNEREELYELVKVTEISGTTLTVQSENGTTKTVDQSECLNANVGIVAEACSDLSKLPHANEAAAMQIIRERYVRDLIYTYAGRLLIAMNPFKAIPGLYDPQTITRYQNADTSRGFPTDLPPHTYAVAQCAMDLMRLSKENQSCIVSGESGAGKTETARQLMQYFASDKAGSGGSRVQDIILGANPVLEAVGNAKTLRNNNSSRFGRFVKLEVAPTGGIHGGLINNYMLELSRIEFQGQGERNYHIFYQMIKGLTAEEKTHCGLKAAEEYEFLNKSGCYEVETVDDLKEFADVRKQLNLLFTKEEQIAYFQVLAAVLLCGNVKFVNVQAMGTDKAGKLQNEAEFDKVASLMGVNKAAMLEAITVNVVEVRGNVIKSPLSAEQSLMMCRSMAKEVYSVFFDFIVASVNEKIKFDHENKVWIGILDIYGFEFFQNNSYEQFLINYANERLQQFFIQQVFQAEQAEYEAEGIDYSMIVYSDNASVLEVFDKPKAGVFAFLEEQCLIQTAACHKNIKSENYEVPKGDARLTFKIIHTAAPVVYTTTEFVPKNKMRLPNELLAVFKKSENIAMQKAFQDVEVPDSKNMRGKFVGSKFQKSMNSLMTTLKSSRAHFCRKLFSELLFALFSQEGGDDKSATMTMLERLGVPKEEYQLGSSKVFLRKAGWLVIDQYFRTVMANLKPLIITLQSSYRALKARSQYLQFATRVVRIQSLMRRYDVRKKQFKKMELTRTFLGAVYTMKLCLLQKRRASAAVVIQKMYRGYRSRKKTAAAMRQAKLGKLLGKTRQGLYHIIRAKKTLQELRQEKVRNLAATKIQTIWRGYVARLRLALMKFLTPYAIVIQTAYTMQKHGGEATECAAFCRRRSSNASSPEKRLIRLIRLIALVYVFLVTVVLRVRATAEWAEGLRRLLAFNEESSLSHIAIGAFHTVLVSGAGFVYSYGLNDRMQLGCPDAGAGVPLPRQPLRGLGQPVQVREVHCGVDHSVLLTMQGAVFAWGANKYSCHSVMQQPEHPLAALLFVVSIHKPLENTSSLIDHPLSLLRIGLPQPLWISLSDLLDGPPPVAVHCGLGLTYLVRADGSLRSFGRAPNGQLGLGRNARCVRIPQKIHIPGQLQELRVGSNLTLALTATGEVFQWGTFLLWDEAEEVCVKAQTFQPMLVDLARAGVTAPVSGIGVGWWEAVVLSSDGRLWAWNFFERVDHNSVSPALYQYELAEKRSARKLRVVSSPLLCAVLAEFGSAKEEAKARKLLGAPPKVMCTGIKEYPDFEKEGLLAEESIHEAETHQGTVN